jgi:hypothetical protein
MIVKINTKYAEGEHGPWLSISNVPQKVLLEAGTGEPGSEIATGKPAIKIGNSVFHFGQPTENITKYRVLALQTVVVCIQE